MRMIGTDNGARLVLASTTVAAMPKTPTDVQSPLANGFVQPIVNRVAIIPIGLQNRGWKDGIVIG